MRIIAVIAASGEAWREWVALRAPYIVSMDVASGDGWTAYRCMSFDVPWQGVANEIVILPDHGGFTSLSQALPLNMAKAA